ncbi:hypothetical protein [Acinetobacter puyangensis]|uniref:hypothetical protein n=1 Tax=Acinetobacter puyangensis TaxID=1096779 RepID=UPI003A4DC363
MDRLSEFFSLTGYNESQTYNKLRDEIITNVIQSVPLLADRKVIGVGHSAYVFDGTRPDTVLKLTTDPASLLFAYHANSKKTVGSKHFPKFHKDYGTVGVFEIADGNEHNKGEIPLVLYEVEKITNKLDYILDITEVALDNALDIQSALQFRKEMGLKPIEDLKELDRFTHSILIYLELKSRWKAKSFENESLLDAIFTIIDFATNTEFVRESFATTNIMQRANGDIVFIDSVSNWLCTGAFQMQEDVTYRELNHYITIT